MIAKKHIAKNSNTLLAGTIFLRRDLSDHISDILRFVYLNRSRIGEILPYIDTQCLIKDNVCSVVGYLISVQ